MTNEYGPVCIDMHKCSRLIQKQQSVGDAKFRRDYCQSSLLVPVFSIVMSFISTRNSRNLDLGNQTLMMKLRTKKPTDVQTFILRQSVSTKKLYFC